MGFSMSNSEYANALIFLRFSFSGFLRNFAGGGFFPGFSRREGGSEGG